MSDDYRKRIVLAVKQSIEKNGLEYQHIQDLYDLCIEEQQNNADFTRNFWFSVSGFIKRNAQDLHIKTLDGKYGDLFDRTLLWEAPFLFESFMLYMEKNRPPEERFYQPRINPLRRIAQGIQDLYDDNLDELSVNCPGRIGKTQIMKMGHVWWGSNRPENSNLYTAFSDKITGGYYDGIKELITDPTYCYKDIFPNNNINGLTDGKDLTIDINRKKTYPTFTCRSIYGTLNGACDCDGLAIADDLFSGIEEAINEERQITVWGKYDNNFIPRLKRKAKLINMGTRWAIRDCQGRRQELIKTDPEYKDVRYREIIIPALNEKDESNFDYPYNLGYSTSDYRKRRASFEKNDDMASWYAQYQQEPVERQGALFKVENMKFFNPEKDLPIETPDRIFAAVDPAYGGGDFVSMPICYQFGNNCYVVDVVYNDGDKKITVPEVTKRMILHLDKFPKKTAEVHFEETKTTTEYRTLCEKVWKEECVAINTTHDPAPNNESKKDRIRNHAPDIRELFFIDMHHRSKEYSKYFQNILMFTYDGKMKHDDGIDSTAQLCDMIYGAKRKQRNTTIVSSPI